MCKRVVAYRYVPILLLAGVLSMPLAHATDTLVVAEPEYAEIAVRLADQLPKGHLMRLPFDDTISGQAWTNYFNSLDYNHLYFLQSDIDTFHEQITTLDDTFREGDLTFGYLVFDIFKRRVADRNAYIDELLDKGFDLTIDESFEWKRKNAPWPRNDDEWDELWRLKIKNEYVRQIVSQRLVEEAASSAATNDTMALPVAAESAAGTNAAATNAADTLEAPVEVLTPEASIRKRYEQMLTVLRDSDAEWILQKYCSAFTQAYDPHSEYMSPSAVEDFDIEMQLSLVGIGALLRAEDGAAKVVRLIPGGPADRDTRERRLRPGDKIIAVGQGREKSVDVLHWPLYRIVRLIRGEKGTRVVLTVIPASDHWGATTKRVDLVRDEVKLEEQAAAQEVRTVTDSAGRERKLGVIKLPAFYASMNQRDVEAPRYRSAAADVATILSSMGEEGVEGVLLDLRNNGGGSLLEAIHMTGLFIHTGPTVQVREQRRIRVLPDRNPAIAYGGPLVVLVNRLSASASEILAGALQDYGRAIIVGGAKTHGKGTVQTIVQLGKEKSLGALRVTTASYYRIAGASTQLRGITPDIIIPSPFDYLDVGEDSLPNPIPWSMVMAARYLPVADLDFIIPELRRDSEARRRQDARFEAYYQLLNRIREINENQSLPLGLETRMALARSEEELAELQDSLMPYDDVDEEDDGDRDLVLEESLRIAADFVSHRPAAPVQPDAEHDRKPLMQVIEEWLDNAL